MDAATEPPKFADISTFLLGSGIALLIALLAWGEQIRAITRDTRELERDFLELTGVTRTQLNAVLNAKSDDDRLVAFTNLMGSGRLTSASHVQLLPLFNSWRILGAKLQAQQARKYWCTIALTLVFFVSGSIASLFPIGILPLLVAVLPPAVIVIALLWIVISAGRIEQRLSGLLKQIAEKV